MLLKEKLNINEVHKKDIFNFTSLRWHPRLRMNRLLR